MAVTANQVLKRKDGERASIPSAAVHHYESTFCFRDSSGYGTNTTNSGANPFQGIVISEVDNSAGAAGDLPVELYRDGVFFLTGSGFTQADVGKSVYATDNYTISLTQGATGVYMGRITEFKSSTVVGIAIDQTGAAGVAAALTEITHTAPGTPDYAVQDLTTSTPYGFVTKDEGNSVLSVVKNLQQRVAALEAR